MKGSFLTRVEEICQSGVYGLILREKGASDEAYEWLARKVMPICERYSTRLILHEHVWAAMRLKHPYLHVSMDTLMGMQGKERRAFWMLGASCHSQGEVRKAICAGATYVTLSPIFETTCKPEAIPLGLEALAQTVGMATVPVIALGGISDKNVGSIRKNGAEGIAVRGAYMTCENVEELTHMLQEKWRESAL